MDAIIKKQIFRWAIRKKGKQVFNICTQYALVQGLVFGLLAGASTMAHANPAGGSVTSGTATISSSGSELDVNQTSKRAVINWNSFDIANGETTRFVQPGASSVALNRVTTSGQVSAINGNLLANGHVIIVNPNGVLIGPHGNVDAAGFIATSADIGDAAFMNAKGRMDFNKAGKAGAVVENQGHITVENAGLGLLVGPTVKNSGVIQGRLSRLQMGAGDTFGVDLYGDGLLSLAVSHPTHSKRRISANNTGSLIADGGKVLMTAAAADKTLDSVINTSGVVEAGSLVNHNGEIILTGTGADVKVAGTVSTSGASGGGKIRIGGDSRGAGKLPKARSVTIDKTAVISADATDKGNGGSIALWSNAHTASAGQFSAKGGPNGGDGGMVETSSKGVLDINGMTVDALAPLGATGSWVIDPKTIDIVDTSDFPNAKPYDPVADTNTSTGGTTHIDVDTINNAKSNIVLAATDAIHFDTDVNITTDNVSLTAIAGVPTLPGTGIDGITPGTGRITLFDHSIRTDETNVTFIAGNRILLDDGWILTHGGDIDFTAGHIDIYNHSDFHTLGGDINLLAIAAGIPHDGEIDLEHSHFDTTGAQDPTIGGLHVNVAGQSVDINDIGDNNIVRANLDGGAMNVDAQRYAQANHNCFRVGGTVCLVPTPPPPPPPTSVLFDVPKEDPLGRPIISYGDLVIRHNTPIDPTPYFNPIDPLVMATNVSIKWNPDEGRVPQAFNKLNDISPAAGTPSTPAALQNIAPGAGGPLTDVDCANAFLDNLSCGPR